MVEVLDVFDKDGLEENLQHIPIGRAIDSPAHFTLLHLIREDGEGCLTTFVDDEDDRPPMKGTLFLILPCEYSGQFQVGIGEGDKPKEKAPEGA